ncbi:hypothetical protein PRZ48_005520 [Zasmidium cellare]|uniref:Uncharacterized protein n=1 Tax=Zasmidium cellare TaxID=395010 RepID=A0ABR0ESK4_ZASCE|nr:hypothetical protein PRZ48_005520 [Zasmidium cellare]
MSGSSAKTRKNLDWCSCANRRQHRRFAKDKEPWNLTNAEAELQTTTGTLSKISAEHGCLKSFAEKSWVELFEKRRILNIRELFAAGLLKEDDRADFESPSNFNSNSFGCIYIWDLADVLTTKESDELTVLEARPILASWLYYFAICEFRHGEHAAILAVIQKRFLKSNDLNPWYLPFIKRYVQKAVVALAEEKSPESLAIAISLATQCLKRIGFNRAALADMQHALPLPTVTKQPPFVAAALIRFYKALHARNELLLPESTQGTYAGLNISTEVFPWVNDQSSTPELALTLFGTQVSNSTCQEFEDNGQTTMTPIYGWIFALPAARQDSFAEAIIAASPTATNGHVYIRFDRQQSGGEGYLWDTSFIGFVVKNYRAGKQHFQTFVRVARPGMGYDPSATARVRTVGKHSTEHELFGPLEGQQPRVKEFFQKHYRIEMAQAVLANARKNAPQMTPGLTLSCVRWASKGLWREYRRDRGDLG